MKNAVFQFGKSFQATNTVLMLYKINENNMITVISPLEMLANSNYLNS